MIQLNRPKALNALCDQLLSELQAALDAAAADVGCGCVIITGNGRAFAAGADITELRPRTLAGIIADEFPGPCAPRPLAAPRPSLAALRGPARGPAGSDALLSGLWVGRAWSAAAKCKLPIVAAVNGLALGGGCELAMMCDIVIASDKVRTPSPRLASRLLRLGISLSCNLLRPL